MKLSNQRILVVGDLMIDRNWCGTATRLSTEAPVLVVKIDRVFDEPGGAANVVENLRSLGVEVDMYGGWGPIKNRLWIEDRQVIRWDENDTSNAVISLTSDLLSTKYTKVIIADYAKGTITDALLAQIYGLGAPVFVDTKADPSKYTGWITAIFPNKSEYERYPSQYDLFERCILKLGPAGIAELQFGKVKQSFPAYSTEPISTNGAGDVVIAAYALKWPGRDALPFANAAAAASVEKKFTGTVTLQDIQNVRKRIRKQNQKRN